MEVKELRIGDWVNINQYGNTRKDVQINSGNDIDAIGSTILDAKPIKLTPEIVERCEGFKKNEGLIITSYDYDISMFGGFKIISVTAEEGNQYIYLRQGELNKPREQDSVIVIYNADVSGDITLHYLQNLIYALTGRELIFNQNKQ